MSTTVEALSSGGFNVIRTVAVPALGVFVSGKLFLGIKYIEEGEEALKLRHKKVVGGAENPRVYGPGRHYELWGYSVLKPVSKIPRSLDLKLFEVEHDHQYKVQASGFWNVKKGGENTYKALYHAVNLDETVTDFCRLGLTAAMLTTREKDLQNRPIIFDKMKEASKDDLDDIGVELLKLSSYNASRTFAEVHGEKIVEAARILAGFGPEKPENKDEARTAADNLLALVVASEVEQLPVTADQFRGVAL